MNVVWAYAAVLGLASVLFVAGCVLTIAGGVIRLRYKASPKRALVLALAAFVLSVGLVALGRTFGSF